MSQTTASTILTSANISTSATITLSNSDINNAGYSSFISPTATFLPTTMTSLHSTMEAPTTKSPVQPSTNSQTCPVSGEPTIKSTCSLFTVKHDFPWNVLKNESSSSYQDIKTNLSATFCNVLKDHGSLVMLLELTFNEAEGGGTIANVTLCLNISDGVDLEEVLRNNIEISTFEAIGVFYSDWKRKDGECEKCGENGGGGPIEIERVCKNDTHSCRGHKNKSQQSEDCVKYCPSASSLVVAAVSNLILAMWIYLSFKS